MRDILGEIVSIIVIVLLFIAFFFGVYMMSIHSDEERWNDGHCDCGGIWEYEQAVGHRSSTSYIYVCGNCGRRIEIHEVR